jgi:23S rRNA (guanosine2251-2'-O)-methyltransferase
MREWISGRNPVYEVLRARRRRCYSLQLASAEKLPIERVPRGRLQSFGDGNQGVALETDGYPYVDLADILEVAEERREPAFILILDALQDPQNLGTLLRSAEAVGVHGVLLPLRHTAMVTPAVVNASSGASEHLRVAQANLAQAIQTLKMRDVWVVGMEASPEAMLPDQVRLDGPLALVVGSEGEGMRHLVKESCDVLLRLPMRGQVASLNAAVAGSIVLYMIWQKRGFL